MKTYAQLQGQIEDLRQDQSKVENEAALQRAKLRQEQKVAPDGNVIEDKQLTAADQKRLALFEQIRQLEGPPTLSKTEHTADGSPATVPGKGPNIIENPAVNDDALAVPATGAKQAPKASEPKLADRTTVENKEGRGKAVVAQEAETAKRVADPSLAPAAKPEPK